MNGLNSFLRDRRGVTAIEYALLAAATALLIVGVMNKFTSSMNDHFVVVNGAMDLDALSGGGSSSSGSSAGGGNSSTSGTSDTSSGTGSPTDPTGNSGNNGNSGNHDNHDNHDNHGNAWAYGRN